MGLNARELEIAEARGYARGLSLNTNLITQRVLRHYEQLIKDKDNAHSEAERYEIGLRIEELHHVLGLDGRRNRF